MSKTVTILLLVLISGRLSSVFAQSFRVNLSPQHLTKINKAKSGHAKLKQYKKFFTKDSARHMKKLDRHLRRKSDSLDRVMLVQEKARKRAERRGVVLPVDTLRMLEEQSSFFARNAEGVDSLVKEKGLSVLKAQVGDNKQLQEIQSKYGLSPSEAQQFLQGDSATKRWVRMQALGTAKTKAIAALPPGQRKQFEEIQSKYGPYSKELNGYVGFLKDSVDLADTLKVIAAQNAEAYATQMVANKLAGEQMGQLKELEGKVDEMKSAPEKYKEELEAYKDPEKLKAMGKEKVQEKALDHFEEHADKLQSVMSKMSKLKGKYSSLLNSNDLSTGTKAKSLEGRPLRERWVMGGNVNIASTAPFLIDLSPQFGYRIDKKFQVGVSGIYRAAFGDSVRISNSISPERYGYSVFSNYALILNFFAYAEWERTTNIVKPLNGDKASLQWTNSLLVGVGRKFRIHPKVSGSLLLLWNPLHKNGTTPYQSAFVVKTGIHLSELAMLKK